MSSIDNVLSPSGLHPAWLLHRRPFRNTSLIVDLFLPAHGRIAAVARGGRKNALLAPFQPLWVGVAPSGEMYRLQQCEPRGSVVSLQRKALYCGFYLNEILCRVLQRDDAHPEVWENYASVLQALPASDALDVELRNFELSLLDAIGYGVALSHDSEGRPIDAQGEYSLDGDRGLVQVDSGGFSGQALLAMEAQQWTPQVRKEAKLFCRQALSSHLGDRPLKSRELFRE